MVANEHFLLNRNDIALDDLQPLPLKTNLHVVLHCIITVVSKLKQ